MSSVATIRKFGELRRATASTPAPKAAAAVGAGKRREPDVHGDQPGMLARPTPKIGPVGRPVSEPPSSSSVIS